MMKLQFRVTLSTLILLLALNEHSTLLVTRTARSHFLTITVLFIPVTLVALRVHVSTPALKRPKGHAAILHKLLTIQRVVTLE